MHRDVTPHNIFVTYDGQTKVVDFGIAKAAVLVVADATGVVKGKIAYMAPEQALCERVDRRADIFSVGVILFEIISGQRLWGNLNEVQILQKLAVGDIPRLSARKPDVPGALDAICARALSVTPAERYPTAAAFRQELEDYVKVSGIKRSSSDVGRFVSELFQDSREDSEANHPSELAGTDGDAAPPGTAREAELPDASVAEALAPSQASVVDARTSATLRKPVEKEAAPNESALVATGDAALTPTARQGRGPLVAALLATGLALAVGVFVVGRPSPAASPNGSPIRTASAAAEPGRAPTALIDLRVDAMPREATIYLDDVAVSGNPFSAKFAGDGTGHRLRIEAPKFKTESRVVVFDRDFSIEIKLNESAAASDGGADGARRSRATRRPCGPRGHRPVPPVSGRVGARRSTRRTHGSRINRSWRDGICGAGPRWPSFSPPASLPPLPTRSRRPVSTRTRRATARGKPVTDSGEAFSSTPRGDSKRPSSSSRTPMILSPNWKLLYNIGQCSKHLGDGARSLRAFERYLLEGRAEIGKPRRTEVEREIADLSAIVGRIEVTAAVEGAVVAIDGAAQGKTPLGGPLFANAGRHHVTASKEGAPAVARDVVVPKGGSVKVEFELTPPEPPKPIVASAPPPRAPQEPRVDPKPADLATPPPGTEKGSRSGWITAGWVATGALAVGAGITGALALAASKDLAKSTYSGPASAAPADLQAKSARVDRFAVITDVLAGAAILTAGASVVIMVTDRKEPRAATPRAKLHLTPGGAVLDGTF